MDHAGDSTDCVDCIEADDCLRHVRHADGDDVTFLDTNGLEGLLGLEDLWYEVPVGGVLSLEGKCDLVRVVLGALEQSLAYRIVGIVQMELHIPVALEPRGYLELFLCIFHNFLISE